MLLAKTIPSWGEQLVSFKRGFAAGEGFACILPAEGVDSNTSRHQGLAGCSHPCLVSLQRNWRSDHIVGPFAGRGHLHHVSKKQKQHPDKQEESERERERESERERARERARERRRGGGGGGGEQPIQQSKKCKEKRVGRSKVVEFKKERCVMGKEEAAGRVM